MDGERKKMSSVSTRDKASETSKDYMVLTAFQTACLAIIVLTAKFVGDLLYGIVLGKFCISELFFLLIFASVLNFFELVNNWASINKYFRLYNGFLFSVDVITLGVFFWQMYILSKVVDDWLDLKEFAYVGLERKIMLIIMVSYGIIFMLYDVWNAIIFRSYPPKDYISTVKRIKIVCSAEERFIQAYILLISIPLICENGFISRLCVFILFCILYVINRNREQQTFNAIIQLKEKT